MLKFVAMASNQVEQPVLTEPGVDPGILKRGACPPPPIGTPKAFPMKKNETQSAK